jgi:hypothetical protein
MVFNVLVTAFWISEIESKKETPLQVEFNFSEQIVISNQYLANTEGGRAQSLFVGPKTA